MDEEFNELYNSLKNNEGMLSRNKKINKKTGKGINIIAEDCIIYKCPLEESYQIKEDYKAKTEGIGH
jgi:hypothetical protein